MLSDLSSLTDTESEDEIYVSSSKARKGRPKKEWQPKQVLKAPRLTQYSTATLYEEILNGKVDLEPEYQRNVVWSDVKQSGLIDSILRNFYIPPVIFAFTQTEDGEERRTCIDGKQRLTSIQRFMDGQISFKDSRTNLKLWYKIQPGNEKGRLLPAQYRKQFDLKQISCVEYTDISDDAEREIFQRVQLGVALTPAERMQAILGPWPQLVREVLNMMEEYRFSDSLEWSKTRGRDFYAVTSIIYIMEKQVSSHPSVIMLEKWLQRVTPPDKAFKDRVLNAFTIFRQLVLTKKFSTVFQKPTRVSPIEFVMTVILIDAQYRDHTLTQLTDGIRLMRKDVRTNHTDIRANTKVMKTILKFIHEEWPDDLKKEPGERKALDECKANPIPKPLETGKRKRNGASASSDEDGSEEERPVKAKVKTVVKATITTNSTAQTNANASRPSVPLKQESSVKVKMEPAMTSEIRPSTKPDRLAEVRKARERAGMIATPLSQVPTPPPTNGSSSSARHTPVPQTQNVSAQDQVSSIINNPNPPIPHPQMWPVNQFNPQMAMGFASQFPTQMYHPNMPIPGQGPMPQMMPPPSNSNAMPSSTTPAPTDPRMNANRSGPPTPNMHGVNGSGWPSPNDPNQNAAPNQRSMSMPSVPGQQAGDGRYDHPGQSGSNSRHDSPHMPPTDPRGGRASASPNMRGQPSYGGTSGRDRDRDVLDSHSGGINGRDRDRGWASRNGR